MSKRKVRKIWVCRKRPRPRPLPIEELEMIEIFVREPMYHEAYVNPWDSGWRPDEDAASFCVEKFELVLGEKLPPWPQLAEISVPPFKITKIWEPVG